MEEDEVSSVGTDVRESTLVDSVRLADPVQHMRLMDDVMIQGHVVEEDPELEVAIAMSIASYEENLHKMDRRSPVEMNEERANRILREREEEEEKRRETERENRRIYKESLQPHFEPILTNTKIWHRLPDTREKATFVENIIQQYYEQSSVYMYIKEDDYHRFYDILQEMQDERKVRNPLNEMDKKMVMDHIRLLEEF